MNNRILKNTPPPQPAPKLSDTDTTLVEVDGRIWLVGPLNSHPRRSGHRFAVLLAGPTDGGDWTIGEVSSFTDSWTPSLDQGSRIVTESITIEFNSTTS